VRVLVSVRVLDWVIVHPNGGPDTERCHRLASLLHADGSIPSVRHVETDTLVLANLCNLRVNWESVVTVQLRYHHSFANMLFERSNNCCNDSHSAARVNADPVQVAFFVENHSGNFKPALFIRLVSVWGATKASEEGGMCGGGEDGEAGDLVVLQQLQIPL